MNKSRGKKTVVTMKATNNNTNSINDRNSKNNDDWPHARYVGLGWACALDCSSDSLSLATPVTRMTTRNSSCRRFMARVRACRIVRWVACNVGTCRGCYLCSELIRACECVAGNVVRGKSQGNEKKYFNNETKRNGTGLSFVYCRLHQ